MTLDQVPAGARVFVDSNIFVYHFQPHPSFGPMCHRLLERIERQDVEGCTSTNLLGELAHRLMVIESRVHRSDAQPAARPHDDRRRNPGVDADPSVGRPCQP
jgi:predicted nucleic acid-binding protein